MQTARRAVLLELDSCSAVSGDGARVRVASQAGSGRLRQAQAGSGGRCAKDRAQGLLAEGKKINLAVGAQWHSKKKKKRAGSELGRGFEVRPSSGFLGFLVNSETRHTEGANNQISE